MHLLLAKRSSYEKQREGVRAEFRGIRGETLRKKVIFDYSKSSSHDTAHNILSIFCNLARALDGERRPRPQCPLFRWKRPYLPDQGAPCALPKGQENKTMPGASNGSMKIKAAIGFENQRKGRFIGTHLVSVLSETYHQKSRYGIGKLRCIYGCPSPCGRCQLQYLE